MDESLSVFVENVEDADIGDVSQIFPFSLEFLLDVLEFDEFSLCVLVKNFAVDDAVCDLHLFEDFLQYPRDLFVLCVLKFKIPGKHLNFAVFEVNLRSLSIILQLNKNSFGFYLGRVLEMFYYVLS